MRTTKFPELDDIADVLFAMPLHLNDTLISLDDGELKPNTPLHGWITLAAQSIAPEIQKKLKLHQSGQSIKQEGQTKFNQLVSQFSDGVKKALKKIEQDQTIEKKTDYRLNIIAEERLELYKKKPWKIIDDLDAIDKEQRALLKGSTQDNDFKERVKIALYECLKQEFRKQIAKDMSEEDMRAAYLAAKNLRNALTDFKSNYTDIGSWMQKMAMQKAIKVGIKESGDGLTPIVIAQCVEFDELRNQKSQMEKVLEMKFSGISEFLYWLCQYFNQRYIAEGKEKAKNLLRDIEQLSNAIDPEIIEAEKKLLEEMSGKAAEGIQK